MKGQGSLVCPLDRTHRLCPCPVSSVPSRSCRSSCGTLKQSTSLGDAVLINRKHLIIIIVGLRIVRGCKAQPHPPTHTHTAPEGKVTPSQDGKFFPCFVISPHYIGYFPWHSSAGTPGKPFAIQTQFLLLEFHVGPSLSALPSSS